jgi:hypothetical protein
VIEAFKAQPPEVSTAQALGNAMRLIFGQLTREQLQREQERQELIFTTPGLRVRMMDEVAATMKMLTELIAERTGRVADDLDVRIYSGALLGVAIGLMVTAPDTDLRDLIAQVEVGLNRLEAGLKL